IDINYTANGELPHAAFRPPDRTPPPGPRPPRPGPAGDAVRHRRLRADVRPPLSPETAMKENPIRSLPGIPVVLLLLAAIGCAAWAVLGGLQPPPVAFGLGLLAAFLLLGAYKLEPNQAAVLSLFGKYVGTVKDSGLRWNNPFYGKRKVSLRVRNFE